MQEFNLQNILLFQCKLCLTATTSHYIFLLSSAGAGKRKIINVWIVSATCVVLLKSKIKLSSTSFTGAEMKTQDK